MDILGLTYSGVWLSGLAVGLLISRGLTPPGPSTLRLSEPISGTLDSAVPVRPVLTVRLSTGKRGRWRWYVSGPEGLIGMSSPTGHDTHATAVATVRRLEASALVFEDEAKGDEA